MIVKKVHVIRELYPTRYTPVVYMDELPDREMLRFEKRDDIYWAEKDGYVEFYYWRGPENMRGFGGWTFPITLTTGEQVTLKGPWSSNTTYVNSLGFEPSIEVYYVTRGETMRSWGYMTVRLATELINKYDKRFIIIQPMDDPHIYTVDKV